MDWSNLQADYERLGTQQAVADLYGVTRGSVDKAMRRLGIPCKPRGKGRKYTWTEERRAAHKAACNTPEFKEAHRVSLLARFADMRSSATDSPLEKLLHGALLRAGLSFSTQRGLLGRYVADIVITQDETVTIEADGFHHRFPDHKAKDEARDAELIAAGYRVFRFSGSEINADPDGCIALVMREASLVRDAEPVADVRRGGRGKENPNWKGAQVEHTCSNCGETFVQYGVNRTYRKKFCNQKCYGAWMREHPEEQPVRARWAKHRAQQVVAQSVLRAMEKA